MRRATYVILAAVALCTSARAGSVLFDFNSAPQFSSLPLDLTVGGITAQFSATGQGFSIQNTAQVIGVLPTGFSGLGIVPNSVFLADLLISFPQTALTDFSIMFAPQDLDTDTSATLRVTASMNGVFVGTSTAVSDYQGTWPSGTLSFSYAQGFNSVVVHYDKPPPSGGDYGVIFVADDMNVVPLVLPGDYNQNGIVDAADYTVWRNNLGNASALPNDDTLGVDVDDYTRWKNNFGAAGAGSGSGAIANVAVPEPATLLMLLVAVTGFSLANARKCHKLVQQ